MTAMRETSSTPEETNSSGATMKLVAPTLSFDERARALGQRFTKLERDGEQIGRDLVTLEREWKAANGSKNFEAWFSKHSGIPRGSIYHYRSIGIAVLAGIAEETTPEDRSSAHSSLVKPSGNQLAAAGRAIQSGKTREEVRDAVRKGTTYDVARAAQSGGTTPMPMTLTGKDYAGQLAVRIKDAYAEVTTGETLEHAEALEIGQRAALALLTPDILVTFLRVDGEHVSLDPGPYQTLMARLRHLETRRAISERVSRATLALLEVLEPILVTDVDLREATSAARTSIRAAMDELEEWTRGDQA
jgi:hypothetical protein